MSSVLVQLAEELSTRALRALTSVRSTASSAPRSLCHVGPPLPGCNVRVGIAGMSCVPGTGVGANHHVPSVRGTSGVVAPVPVPDTERAPVAWLDVAQEGPGRVIEPASETLRSSGVADARRGRPAIVVEVIDLSCRDSPAHRAGGGP